MDTYTANALTRWVKYGQSARYIIWRAEDENGAYYNVTVLDFPPSVDSGYRNLGALLAIKNDLSGYKLTEVPFGTQNDDGRLALDTPERRDQERYFGEGQEQEDDNG